MKKIILLGLVYLSLTTFAQQKPADTKSDEQAIRTLSMKWLELTKKHDIAACAALFADDGIEYSSNKEPSVGPAAIAKEFTRSHEKNPKEVVNWSTERVEVAASGDLAVEYGNYDVKALGKNGTKSDQGKYVTVYRKVNGTWKVAADIGASTKPEPESK